MNSLEEGSQDLPYMDLAYLWWTGNFLDNETFCSDLRAIGSHKGFLILEKWCIDNVICIYWVLRAEAC